jgi:LuxR family maltose regulon positive regulatory protein
MVSRTIQDNIHIPQVSGVIERSRLVAQLHTASTKRLTLICAPPGYGKTTLAAQYAHQAYAQVVWHTMEIASAMAICSIR